MTIQNTFFTADNTANWFMIEVDDRLPGGMMPHPILQWKIQGLDGPAVPVTVSGGPTIMTRSTDWFVWNNETNHLYGMDASGCWYKKHLCGISELTTSISEAIKQRVVSRGVPNVQNH